MRVFELMEKLSTMPAGADVKICMVKSMDELPEFDGDETLRSIDFKLKEVVCTGTEVTLDGWRD